MRKRLGRVLSLVVLCAMVGAPTVWAEREAPREKKEGKVEPRRKVELHRAGKTVGKWRTVKNFTAPAPFGVNDCAGVCDEEICVCWEDWWDPGCCDLGCDICWWVIDNT